MLSRGATWSDNPFAECDQVVVCLYESRVVRSVLQSMAPAFRAGQSVIDATTGGPDDATHLGDWLAAHGVAYLESPIAASSEQTRRGEATAFVGGAEEDFRRLEPLLSKLVARAHYAGPWGAAACLKLVNNLILGLNRAALAEGLALADRLGLDGERTLDVLKRCNAYSGVMETKGPKMVAADFSPQATLRQHAKDVRIILDEATRRGLRLPMSSRHLELLELGELQGWGDLDNSAVLRVIAEGLQRDVDDA